VHAIVIILTKIVPENDYTLLSRRSERYTGSEWPAAAAETDI